MGTGGSLIISVVVNISRLFQEKKNKSINTEKNPNTENYAIVVGCPRLEQP